MEIIRGKAIDEKVLQAGGEGVSLLHLVDRMTMTPSLLGSFLSRGVSCCASSIIVKEMLKIGFIRPINHTDK